ncbi:alpha-L-glutamate ligase-like protein [Thiohalorhabdus denitrificans]|uniref:Alpha-L-glutamate ligase-related protein n=1 Tax=Thiohalorhabdus denitrificans TaxID=381306 RepID=A0A1G5AB75_9GAMM|nr:alpha-L-glutamate ligase-like protein [Thiohalorhabdus denitrificans]SCX75118.1 alpha-L-glutamate ligase-related protein [Thiohalorhabdus denitrificans]
MLVRPRRLLARGVIGMNRRNVHYVGRYNDRRLYPLVDDKLRTKLLAREHGVTTPELIGVVRSQFEVKQVADRVAGRSGFAVKPAKGSGGKGLLVIDRQEDGRYLKPSGAEVTRKDLQRHLSNILSGLYSLGGAPDAAVIEELIRFDHGFADFTYEGVPDIRVIVFRGYPVMAMMRLPTAASDGKANLHQGAVGVGLDLTDGRALRGVQFGRPRTDHPDTGRGLDDLKVPYWETLLNLAAGCYEFTGLGFLGTDLVLDRHHGPMLLELNARPGLAIQVANGQGLRGPLDLVEGLPEGRPVHERVAFSRERLGHAPVPAPERRAGAPEAVPG